MIYLNRRRKYLEAISSQAASLSLSNISNFYKNYVKDNLTKVENELDRVGYFTLKNKMSIGNEKSKTKDIYISTYIINTDKSDACNQMLRQKYHGDVDVRSVGGFFVPSTNELVVLIPVKHNEYVDDAVANADIRSTIEHEITHAFDSTNRNVRLSKQKGTPSVGDKFLSACAYLGCADRSDIANILTDGIFTDSNTLECIYAISIILYKLFTLTEFNAHQVSDLEETRRVNPEKSEEVKAALKKDLLTDYNITKHHLDLARSVTPAESPYLWKVIGNVLSYMGYRLPNKSPDAVYKYFTRMSNKLFDKFLKKKMRNQSKAIASLKEKKSIKDAIRDGIDFNNMNTGISFWYSPLGDTNSYLCRVKDAQGNLILTVNNKPITIYGNANEMMRRAVNAFAARKWPAFEFALDNLVDVLVQSIERKFNNVQYDPVYDITEPQDEVQASQSNKRANRFADLDWD